MGLPLALGFAERGRLEVTGFDTDRAKMSCLVRGESPIGHVAASRIRAARESGRLRLSESYEELQLLDALIISVPTPLSPQRTPDLSLVSETLERLTPRLRRGHLVVLESTTYPGTTEELVVPALARSGLRLGEELFVAYCPEREDPGNSRFGTTNTPRLVGGIEEVSTGLAVALYSTFVEQVIPVSSTRLAEAAKLTENAFRSVNIALVNELKMVFDKLGIDVWEVLDAAATKPFGFMRFDPGPGLGGHCIPIDPYYLAYCARLVGGKTPLVELAGEVNRGMPGYVMQKLTVALDRRLSQARVLVVGLGYKRDVDDSRESPALEIIRMLFDSGAEVEYHDPLLMAPPQHTDIPRLAEMRSVPLTAKQLGEVDAVLIVTDHTAIDYTLVLAHARLIVDARGVYREPHPKVVKA